jgi:predicted xylose isomerase-like sugar epimerase
VSHSLFAHDLFFTLSLGLVHISNVNPACSCD